MFRVGITLGRGSRLACGSHPVLEKPARLRPSLVERDAGSEVAASFIRVCWSMVGTIPKGLIARYSGRCCSCSDRSTSLAS